MVFPAYAGMSPGGSTVCYARARFPRLRGDEPPFMEGTTST